jgi:hypothetical protein
MQRLSQIYYKLNLGESAQSVDNLAHQESTRAFSGYLLPIVPLPSG